MIKSIIVGLTMFLVITSGAYSEMSLNDYNIVWDSPSKDSYGSMPLGNGDIGINVWMEENGDLCFYISKTDSWGDNGRLLKVGKVRISLSPNPLTDGSQFKQTLNLQNGEVLIDIDGDNPTQLKIWIDANNPVIHVESESKEPVKATAKIELWRTERTALKNVEVGDHRARVGRTTFPDGTKRLWQEDNNTYVEPDTLLNDLKDGIGWYHRNEKSDGPAMSLKFQGLEGYTKTKGYKDPLLHRIFGAVIKAKEGQRVDDKTLVSKNAKKQSIKIAVKTLHPGTVSEWLAVIENIFLEAENSTECYKAHKQWWEQFWQRSHIAITQSKGQKPSYIPVNSHPLTFGASQNGGAKLKGKLGRISLFPTILTNADIKRLYESSAEQAQPLKTESLASGLFKTGTRQQVELGQQLTMEAWVKPDKSQTSYRIIDKVTAGKPNGFLLDIHSNTLRLLVGHQSLTLKNALPAEQWTHITAMIDSKQESLKLYLNGKLAAEKSAPLNDAFIVSRSYNLQRFIDASGGRGRYPIKFNGSIFTVPHPGKPGNADYRQWGACFWWQNTRLPYTSMCASGDYDLMEPMFRFYIDEMLPVNKYRTKKYFGFDGAYFLEMSSMYGTVPMGVYGWDKQMKDRKDPLQRNRFHKWEWVAGPELVFMMQDYYDYTGDEEFLTEKILPTAKAVASFFMNFYKTNDKGTMVMHPSMACETWWDCTNPMPEVAGLHAITDRLNAMDSKLSSEDRKFWGEFKKVIPAIPLRDTESGKALAPAQKFADKHNFESPELYAVFPFRQIAVGAPNLEWGINAMKHRWNGGTYGWYQDNIFQAYLGLTDDAKKYIISRCKNSHKGSRFPAFWGPNYDWIPDQDHGGVLMKALQAMILQPDPYSRKLYVAPAWPKDWNCQFKLHAPYKTTIEGEIKDGKVIILKVVPESRKKDIILPKSNGYEINGMSVTK